MGGKVDREFYPQKKALLILINLLTFYSKKLFYYLLNDTVAIEVSHVYIIALVIFSKVLVNLQVCFFGPKISNF